MTGMGQKQAGPSPQARNATEIAAGRAQASAAVQKREGGEDTPVRLLARLARHAACSVQCRHMTDRLQPFADLAHAESCSSSALASLSTGVSNPSVNQL